MDSSKLRFYQHSLLGKFDLSYVTLYSIILQFRSKSTSGIFSSLLCCVCVYISWIPLTGAHLSCFYIHFNAYLALEHIYFFIYRLQLMNFLGNIIMYNCKFYYLLQVLCLDFIEMQPYNNKIKCSSRNVCT